MHPGIGSSGVSIVFFVPTSRCMTNGFTSKRIPSELDWSPIGKIGHTKSAATTRCRAFGGFAGFRWQAKRLPYNVCLPSRRPYGPSRTGIAAWRLCLIALQIAQLIKKKI